MSVTVRCPDSFAHIVYGPYNLPDFNNLPVYELEWGNKRLRKRLKSETGLASVILYKASGYADVRNKLVKSKAD